MVDHNEKSLQLDRNLNDWRENDHERALLFAGAELMERGLNHFRAVEEAMHVMHHQQGRAIFVRQCRQRPQCRNWIMGVAWGGSLFLGAGESTASTNVPNSK